MYNVTFKGLENVTFQFSPVAFTIFGHDIVWYGVVIVIGMILSAIYAFYRAKKLGIKIDDMYDYAIFLIIFGVIGARLYYVITTPGQYKSFLDVIAIWNGGLAIYGGIIGGLLAVIVTSLVKKIRVLRVLDAIAPSVFIGQIIGRWGNYFNQEAFGCNTTLPWGMRSTVTADAPSSMQGTVEYLTAQRSKIESLGIQIDPNGYVHPTFLYEGIWNLIGFLIIHFLFKKRKFDGQMFLMYISWYGLGRAFIEMLRTDSLYIPGTGIRISMLLGFICFAAGAVALVIMGVKTKQGKLVMAENAYYGAKTEKADNESEENTDNAEEKENGEAEQTEKEPAENATQEPEDNADGTTEDSGDDTD